MIEDWTTHAETENSGTISLVIINVLFYVFSPTNLLNIFLFMKNAGQKYSIELQYFEGGGGAAINLLWSLGTQEPKAIIPNSQLFVN